MPHKHTNSLIKESSPYLLQHAHNPVEWYPWGEEALQKARLENKVILVSIGYAACHWCHVMERESFENETVAEKMNRYFVNIKIDREERPDLDHIYMDAVQAMSGSGGWPLNVFLTPEAKPFYGGTYFPPVRAFNRSSWTEVIDAIAASWQEKANEITSQAENLLQHLEQSGNFEKLSSKSAGAFTKQECAVITENILKQADTVWGGFGKAPKFPQTFSIQYLLQYYHYTKHQAALDQALLSIDKMMYGGIYDHAGGGFSRYSTDTEWLAPHFEKMLYDNALLINVLCDAFQVTGYKKYEETIRHTIAFLQREMQDAEGGFYTALDADSEGEEGKFYVWTKEEVEAVLGDDAALFCEFYDVSENGNWEGKNILRILREPESFAAEKNMEPAALKATLEFGIEQLLAARNKRVRPSTDDKILLGWNALMVTALCKAAAALKDDNYATLAVAAMDFILEKFKKEGAGFEWYHTYKKGIAKYPAFLDDYAFVIQACLQLQEITSGKHYLETADKITATVIENFYDRASGFFMFTHKNQKDVVMRKKEVYDGATPSGNSVMIENLYSLSVIFDNNEWKQIAEKSTLSLSAAVSRYPTSFGVWASIILKQAFGIHELVITGPGFSELRKELLKEYIPGKVLQCSLNEDAAYPLLNGKGGSGENNIYWCRQYECAAPLYSVKSLVNELEKWNYSTRTSQ
jgi:uncharacterized protein